MKTAIIYARAKAPDPNVTPEAIKMQVSACKAFAEKNAIQVIDVYWDIILSAQCQPLAWDKILNISKPEFDYIIVYDYSRIGRDCTKQMKDRINQKNKGVRIITPITELTEESFKQQDKYDEFQEYCYECSKNILRNRRKSK